jgi:uncharacterized protein YndB with AHSA1/START domain
MEDLHLTKAPEVKVVMLIRKPAAEVFEAFVEPAITSRFWFSRGSARLEPGKRVRWDWEMYGVGTDVEVKALEPARRILVEWDLTENSSLVEWTFESKGEDRTYVTVRNWGFRGTADEMVVKALDSQGGFTFVLAAAKALLEHGIELNVVLDHAPDALVEGWAS